jgi:hypothetical protein
MTSTPPGGSHEPSWVLQALCVDKSVGPSAPECQSVECVEGVHRRRPEPSARPNENAMPGPAPTAAPGLDPVELVVDGEKFVVTRRAGSSGTYDSPGPRTPRRTGSASGATLTGIPTEPSWPSRSAVSWPTSTQRQAAGCGSPCGLANRSACDAVQIDSITGAGEQGGVGAGCGWPAVDG